MTCFVCGIETNGKDAAEVYSFESCMCKPCKAAYIKWSCDQGVDPTTIEPFVKEVVN